MSVKKVKASPVVEGGNNKNPPKTRKRNLKPESKESVTPKKVKQSAEKPSESVLVKKGEKVKKTKVKETPKKAKLTQKIKEKKENLKGEKKKPANKKENGEGESKKKNDKPDRKKQKKVKEERKKKSKSEDVFQLSTEAKQIWEKVRREDCAEEEKVKLIEKLHESVKGQLKKVVFAHDTVRVLECLVSLSTPAIREDLFKEAKDDLVAMIKSKYGHYFVEKLLKYGTKDQRREIFKTFEGKVAELMKHKIANNVIETYYNDFANSADRNGMLQEFCGPEFRHFKEPDLRTVQDLLKKHPEKEKYVKRHLAEHVGTLITKGCYNHSFVHTILYNYMLVCNPKERTALIEQLRDVCLNVLHSHDGARLSMYCIWHGTNKDRKAIIKTFKTFVKKICTEEQGYLVMMAVFDTVDDTKLVGKAILQELAENMEEIASNPSGKKVLMHLLAPRNKTYFYPDIISLLEKGDGNEHSKKEAEIRTSELRNVISKDICKYVLEHIKEMLFDNPSTIFLTVVANFAEPKAAEGLLKMLAEEATKPFFKGDDEPNLVEHSATHQMLKKIIAHDKVRTEKGVSTFSELLLESLDQDSMDSWISCNRGAFLMVNMLETNIPVVVEELKKKLGEFTITLDKQKTKGAEILKKKLK